MRESTLYIILAVGLFVWLPLTTLILNFVFTLFGWKDKGSDKKVGSADEYLYEQKEY